MGIAHGGSRRILCQALAVMLLSAWGGFALAVDDRALATKIEYELVRNRVTDNARIEVRSRDGFVTLTGSTYTDHQKRLASEIARRFPGVTAVENRLVVSSQTP